MANMSTIRREAIRRWTDHYGSDNPTINATNSNKSTSGHRRNVAFPSGVIFLAASQSGDIDETLQLLRKGVDPNSSTADGLTAHHQCCIDGNLEMLRSLVEHGADVNAQDNEGWTPLHAAASCDQSEIVSYLLEHGADVTAVNADGQIPQDLCDEDNECLVLLQNSVRDRSIDVDHARNAERELMLQDAKTIRDNGLPPCAEPMKFGATALHVACAKGYDDVVEILLDAGMDVNRPDDDGWTPLHAAAHWKQERACELLSDYDADFESLSNLGQTCLEVADAEIADRMEDLKEAQSKRPPRPKKAGTTQAVIETAATTPVSAATDTGERSAGSSAPSPTLSGRRVSPPEVTPVTTAQTTPPSSTVNAAFDRQQSVDDIRAKFDSAASNNKNLPSSSLPSSTLSSASLESCEQPKLHRSPSLSSQVLLPADSSMNEPETKRRQKARRSRETRRVTQHVRLEDLHAAAGTTASPEPVSDENGSTSSPAAKPSSGSGVLTQINKDAKNKRRPTRRTRSERRQTGGITASDLSGWEHSASEGEGEVETEGETGEGEGEAEGEAEHPADTTRRRSSAISAHEPSDGEPTECLCSARLLTLERQLEAMYESFDKDRNRVGALEKELKQANLTALHRCLSLLVEYQQRLKAKGLSLAPTEDSILGRELSFAHIPVAYAASQADAGSLQSQPSIASQRSSDAGVSSISSGGVGLAEKISGMSIASATSEMDTDAGIRPIDELDENEDLLDADHLYVDECGGLARQQSITSLVEKENRGNVLQLCSRLKLGMDLTTVTFPVSLLDGRSILELFADLFSHSQLFLQIATAKTPCQRMVAVVRQYICAFHTAFRHQPVRKPYNAQLGEVFKCQLEPSTRRTASISTNMEPVEKPTLHFVAEQVSHHPPVSAYHLSSPQHGLFLTADVSCKSKFLGMSAGVDISGQGCLTVSAHNEEYIFTFPSVYCRSILTNPWLEFSGRVRVTCPQSAYQATITFPAKPSYGEEYNKVTAEIRPQAGSAAVCKISGRWDSILTTTHDTGETEVMDITHLSHGKKIVQPMKQQSKMESRRLWRKVTAALRAGDYKLANLQKNALEDAQREETQRREAAGSAWKPVHFEKDGQRWKFRSGCQSTPV